MHDTAPPTKNKNEPINERSFQEAAVAADNTIPKALDIDSDDEAEQFIQRVKNNKDEKDSFAAKRREQSKRASELIGHKLLQQWALVNDICPNETCYAVPLVRDPQQRLFCVICQQTYMTEAAYNKQIQNQSVSQSTPPSTAVKTDAQPTQATSQVSVIDFTKMMIVKLFYEQPFLMTSIASVSCVIQHESKHSEHSHKRRKISVDSAIEICESENKQHVGIFEIAL